MNLKKAFKIVSEISILIGGFSIVASYFNDSFFFTDSGFINIFIIIYLISSLYYHKMEIKDKNKEIKSLKNKILK